MADLRIRDLEEKVAHYEAIMSRCPQCKTNLPTPEAESSTTSARHSRSSRPVQQPATKVPPPALTGPSERPVPASMLSSSARSSKQLLPFSRTELQASVSQKRTPIIPPAETSSRPHRSSEAPASTLRHQPRNSTDHQTNSSVQSSAESSERPATTFQTRITGSSSLALSAADGRNRHRGEIIALDLQQSKQSRSRNQLPKRPDWMRTADIMLEEVPSGRYWREKVTKMDSSIIAAVAMSAAPVSGEDMSPTEDVERKELIRLVRRFAERHSQGRVNFEQFILVCLCKVLSSQGVPQGEIVETLQICISDTGKRNIGRYLKGATWANKMMNELFLTEWGYRAVDLIAIWNRSVSTYGTMGAAPDSRLYFITELTQRKYFEWYQEIPDRRHDTIPWIVKKELGDEVSYRDICEALGYSDEYFMKTKHLHSSNPPSPDLNSGGSDEAGSTSQTGSFHTARQSTISAPSPQQPNSAVGMPSTNPLSASYVRDLSLLRRRPLQGASPDDAAGRDPPTSQSVASQRTNRIVPDRSAKPLGDPDVAPQRRKPQKARSFTELPSTSLGESAPGTQSTKRPLPDSPTSALGPTDTTRRRQNIRERSSREAMGPPSHPEKRVSNNERRRA